MLSKRTVPWKIKKVMASLMTLFWVRGTKLWNQSFIIMVNGKKLTAQNFFLNKYPYTVFNELPSGSLFNLCLKAVLWFVQYSFLNLTLLTFKILILQCKIYFWVYHEGNIFLNKNWVLVLLYKTLLPLLIKILLC